MTMADEMEPQMGNARQMSQDFQQISNNNNSLITNQNIPWKQRKRKRLSAVLDKLHNNNTIITKRCLNDFDAITETNNNNNNDDNNQQQQQQQGEPSKVTSILDNHFHHRMMNDTAAANATTTISAAVDGGGGGSRESIRSSGDDEDDISTDDLRSSVESPFVKREPISSSSPLSFTTAVNDENAFVNGDIKQEMRTSDYEYNNHRMEQNVSPMERYFPQMPPQLFEYYLQTKYLPDILRMRNSMHNLSNAAAAEQKLKLAAGHQQQQQLQQEQHQQRQYSPQSQMAALDLQNKPIKQEDTKMQRQQNALPRKRQRQPKHQQYQSSSSSSFAEKPPPPQDAPLDLSMKTILENISLITKASATHKQIGLASSRSPSTPSSSASSSMSSIAAAAAAAAAAATAVAAPSSQSSSSSNHQSWLGSHHDLSASIPNLANLLVNPAAHLNNHPAFTAAAAAAAVAHHSHSPITSSATGSTAASNSLGQVPIIKGDVASPTTKESVAFRYNINVSPVVEEMPPGTDVAYVCPICGQMFSLHDRLAKHMASRHKSKSSSSEITKSYVCEVCDRSFARSDMLTRHMRLHTGIKPYTCKVCNQVFSRSDHLSTHQRTHTGEKPYKCPQCPYAACRRDMITRHMRTHARYEAQRAAAAAAVAASSNGTGGMDSTQTAVANFQRNLIGKLKQITKITISNQACFYWLPKM